MINRDGRAPPAAPSAALSVVCGVGRPAESPARGAIRAGGMKNKIPVFCFSACAGPGSAAAPWSPPGGLIFLTLNQSHLTTWDGQSRKISRFPRNIYAYFLDHGTKWGLNRDPVRIFFFKKWSQLVIFFKK